MRERLSEPLTIDDLASAAMFSRYHFSRLFRKVTGISPGRFLAALRIQEAKRLLVTTSLTVAVISTSVGYTSLGTFSSRFHRSVGVSPAAYRRHYPESLPSDRIPRTGAGAVITGEVGAFCPHFAAPIFIGLFPDAIAEGPPASWAVVDRPGPYRLSGVHSGTWHVIAHSLRVGGTRPRNVDQADDIIAVARYGPVRVGESTSLGAVNIMIRPPRDVDPPALHSLIDLPPQAVLRIQGMSSHERRHDPPSEPLISIGSPPRILSESIGSGTIW
ncbi:helix-turn-helix domain-containing protein [Micromonospora sp. KLBMP9576]|uniref:helix-turn-helix domain-containing protein n=1 Tax=Micromonospora sp. KLBMP9576 TaxID=3424769 RepID=UPI003D9144E0